jgi:protein TonB
MFGQLLESRATRQRRRGGVALSVAAHIAIIGAATVATAAGKPTPRPRIEQVSVRLVAVVHPKEPQQAVHTLVTSRSNASSPLVTSLPVIQIPVIVPVGLPAMDLTHGIAHDSVVLSVAGGGGRDRHPGLLDLADDSPRSGEWRGSELMMRIVASAKPRYPDALRTAGIEGRVLVQFVVDTLGSVDMSSVKILQSTHDLFTQSVRSALATFRFKPAEVHGKRIRSLAEMPFEFAITR